MPKAAREQPETRPEDVGGRADRVWLLALLGLTALFLAPYLLLGRVMVPLELLAVFQPWARHPEVLGRVPSPLNPLLDALQQYYPRREYFTGALREGWLPFWNPYVYGGSPFLAAQQGGVLYPPAWLLALFPPAAQFGWSALFHLYLGAAGTYLFLREVGLRPGAAGGGGIAFAFNGFVIAWLAYPNVTQWTLCWLPLALWLWERGRGRGDPRWAVAAAGALALAVLGGHLQSTAYVLLGWGSWALLRVLVEERKPARCLAAATGWVAGPALLALAASAAHLLPALEWVPQTDRGGRLTWEAAVRTGMPAAQLWTFLLPRLFGDGTLAFAHQSWLPVGDRAGLAFVERTFYPGIAVLAVACAGLGGASTPRLRVLTWYSAALAVLAVAWALGTPLYRPLWALPGFGQFTAIARIVCLAGWALPCLAAVGLHALGDADAETRRRAARRVTAAAAALALAAVVGWYIHGSAVPAGLSAALAASRRAPPEMLISRDLAGALLLLLALAALTLAAARGARRLPPERAVVAAAALLAADLWSFGFGFNPRADAGLLRGRTPEMQALARFEAPYRLLAAAPTGADGDLRGRMPANLPAAFGFPDIGGSDSFVTRRYRDWEAATRQATGGASPWARKPSPNLRSAGVRYYLVAPGDSTPLPEAGGPGLREDPGALPYARLHPNVQRQASREELLHHLAHPGRVPEVALTLGPDAPESQGRTTVIPLTARRVNGNRLEVTGTSPFSGLVVVCEQYDPAWRARVNGRPERPAAADHLLLGVPAPAGEVRVELTYLPAAFRVGLFISLAALVLALGIACATRPKSSP